MKNDFEFIRDKFDADGVQTPGEINESLVLEQLQNVEPVKVKKNKKAVVGIASASVAGVALVTATALLAANVLNGNGVNSLIQGLKSPAPLYGSAQLTRFRSRDEVETALDNAISEREKRYSSVNVLERGDVLEDGAVAAPEAMLSSGSTAGSASHNTTYVQHTGVDEADTIKTDGEHIFYLTAGTGVRGTQAIEIYSADGRDSKIVGSIGGDDTTDDDTADNMIMEDFFLCGSRLILLSDTYSYRYADQYTEARVYDVSDPAKPALLDTYRQSGHYVSSRMIDDTLYLVSTHTPYDENKLPVAGAEATPDEVPAECIYAVENPSDSSFLVVSSIDTSKGAEMLDTKAILGSADDIYCNRDHLYATAAEYEPLVVDGDVWSNYAVSVDRTQIIKIDLTNHLEATATCYVSGRIDSQYSLDEHEGNLRVATTSTNDDGCDVNNLLVLDDKLGLVGEVTGFAENESIKAVRYMGDTAYVITYEQTDPLFVIDLSAPSAPQILGAVKISGFSTMLVPLDENTILGIGYHTEDADYTYMEVQDGLKLVVFDVSDKSQPVVSDTKIFEGYYSDVQNDPKALVVNAERGDYAVPFNCYPDNGEGTFESFGGVIDFRVNDGKLEIVDEYRSETFQGKDGVYAEVDRCVYCGNTLYMLGEIDDYSYDKSYESISRTAIDCVDYK